MNIEQGHGIKKQLNLSPQQWNWVISCFFYPYAALEPISTLLMKRTTFVSSFVTSALIVLTLSGNRPSFWIGRIMITWGIIVCCVGAVQNYGGLITCRVCEFLRLPNHVFTLVLHLLKCWAPPKQDTILASSTTWRSGSDQKNSLYESLHSTPSDRSAVSSEGSSPLLFPTRTGG